MGDRIRLRRTFFLLLCLCVQLTTRRTAKALDDPASEVIRLVNELRAFYGVPPYQVDAVLMSVAQAQAEWSAANNHIGHDGPGGSMPNDRAQAAGYGAGYRSFATENTAHGTASHNTPELVVTMWQSDYGHLNAMISPDYEHIGVGFAEAGDYSWYVMMVGWIDDGIDPEMPDSGGTPEAAVPVVPFVTSQPDETGAIYHEVQPGQTAWTIAAYYGVDLAELLAVNDLTESSTLHPGDILLVRPPYAPTITPPKQAPTKAPLVSDSNHTGETPTRVTDSQVLERSNLNPLLWITGLWMALLVGVAVAHVVRARRR